MKPFNRGNILNYFSVSVKKAIQYRASLLLDLQNLSKQYDIKDFSVLKKLGEGQFGQVFLVVNNRTNKIYALKCVSKIETLKYKLERHLVVIR
jgi:serine/threonine protein kinase